MVDPLSAAFIATRVKNFFKGLVKSPWFYAALILIAVGGGTYLFLTKDKEQDIAAAVEQQSSKATIGAYQTKDAVARRTEKIDEQFDALAVQTSKDYANARAQLEAAPEAEREAQAPALLIDTLNRLDRLRQDRDGVPLSDADIPVG